jgi:hypothetical protein
MSRRAPATTKRPSTDPVIEAITAVNDNGHKAMRTGRTIACWHCPEDGIVGPDGARIGAIFTKGCSK